MMWLMPISMSSLVAIVESGRLILGISIYVDFQNVIAVGDDGMLHFGSSIAWFEVN